MVFCNIPERCNIRNTVLIHCMLHPNIIDNRISTRRVQIYVTVLRINTDGENNK